MSTLLELREAGGKLLATRNALTALMDKKDDAGKLKWEPADHDRFKELQAQAKAEHDEVKKWEEVEAAANENAFGIEEMKRATGRVPFALRRPVVQDLMPSIPTDYASIVYMEETTNTQNAASVAEAATKPESARVWTQRTVLVEVVATTLPVSEQQLADVPQIRGIIDTSLGQEVELAEETEILGGSGSSPHLQGFLTKTGVQTQAKGSDAVPTAFMKALTLIRFTGFAEPSAAVWHPNDWQDVITLQDTLGRYIFGDPSNIRVNQIWGVPAVITPAETENTILVGDFRMYSYVARRMGLRIDVGYVNDNFAKNLRTLRAETRLALVIRRPAAFCKVTGV
jgi:HK97 family phage major capsid protein